MLEFAISPAAPRKILLQAKAKQHEPERAEFKKMNKKAAGNVTRAIEEMDRLLEGPF
jgi:hypothetical protein